MMVQKFQKFNVQGGSAITLRCIRSESKEGWGKRQADGSVEIYIPKKTSDLDRNEIIIQRLTKLLSIAPEKIEIISGHNDRLIVTIVGVYAESVNKAFAKILK